MINKRNDFKLRFINKDTGKESYSMSYYCGENVFAYINKVKDDLSSLCLVGVSNNTHDLLEVVWCYDNKIIWRNEAYV